MPLSSPSGSKERFWSGLFVALIIASFVTSGSNQAIANLIPLYVDQSGFPATFSGTLVLVFSVASIFGRIFAGACLDSVGRKPVLLIGSICFLVGAAGPALVPDVQFLILWRVWQGIGFAITTTAAATIVADILPRERVREGISFYSIGQSLSAAVGPGAGILLLGLSSISQAFLFVAVGVSVVVGVAVYAKSPWDARLKDQRAVARSEMVRPPRKPWFSFEKRALPVFLVQFIASLAFSQYLNFLSLYSIREGFGKPGLFFAIAAVMMIASRLLLARFLNRLAPGFAFPLLFGLGATSFILVATAASDVMLYLAGALYGVAFGLFTPLMNIIVLAITPQSRWGAATAMNFLGADLGIGLGGILAGIVIESVPFGALFWGGAILMLVACTAALTVIPRRALRKPGGSDLGSPDD